MTYDSQGGSGLLDHVGPLSTTITIGDQSPVREGGSRLRPVSPAEVVTLLLDAYCMGVYSSRRIQKLCESRRAGTAYRVIVGHDVPNFRTISDFRKDHLPFLQGLGERVEDEAILREGIMVWNADRNNRSKGIGWQFKTRDARIKLRRLCPQITMC